MDDDCIHEILSYLDEDSLCSLGTQCRHLRNLTGFELFRRFPQQAARIKRFEQNGYWYRYPNDYDKFIVCYAKFRKLSIRNFLKSAKEIKDLQLYMQAMEQSRVDEIHFERCRHIRPAQGKALAKTIEATKSVTFNGCKMIGEFYTTILCHFPSMENLILRSSLEMVCEEKVKNKWLTEIYPNLKSFSWFIDDEIPVTDELKLFFKQNKTIKHFSLHTRRIETLEQLKGIKITHLYFRVTHDVENKLNYLKEMCRNDESLRLHLMFADECRSQLTSHLKLFGELKTNLRGLYLDGLPPSKRLAIEIEQCIHLKDLQVRHCKFIEQFVTLPKLENVYVSRGMVDGTYRDIYDMIYRFATQAPKLKNLFFRNSCREFSSFRFDQINTVRSQLPGANKMTFHVRTKSKPRIAELARIRVHYDMLNLKITDVESLANPLPTDWLYKH